MRFIVYGALFIATALPSCSRLDASPSGHVAAAARARAPAVATGASVPLPGAGAVSRNADGPVRESQEAEAASGELPGWQAKLDEAMGRVNGVISSVFFANLLWWYPDARLPLVVAWLALAAVFLTLRMGFINLRAFRHAIAITRGRYTNPDEPGEVSHFQALSTALSATVGLGNIAGVAIAISIGGPGATFWLIVAGLLGMTTKFSECTLAQAYRDVGPDGSVLGGPMQYLSRGLSERGVPRLGRVLAVAFAILCIGGSLAGGNSFQVNQSLNALQETVPALVGNGWIYGLLMTALVGVVIIGGIRRIANVADKIVPLMAVIYVLGALTVIVMNAANVPHALAAIVRHAFRPEAAYGGFIGVLVVGFQRAAFSNEAGAGSAAIAHSAARTEYPIREGIVALLEPFIDTVLICTMTALVIVFSGAYANPAYETLIVGNQGAALTSRAFGEHLPYFPHVLSLAVFLFAYSTMISWSYYGERCAVWLFGVRASLPYKILFLAFVFLGSVLTATNVLEFGDLMILGMAFPNLVGVYLLSGKVKRMLDSYWADYKAGKFPVYDRKAAMGTASEG
ncbi:MAG TPA: alanine/glycine:cation symporter family protein [Longimicrobiales bacterium]|nr:alanine/glycine:cation symporter family protein [Longimicrobiales bacterium]